jgi:hypothetical protein
MIKKGGLCIPQCCGVGTRTTGTVTFCLGGTGMHYVSGSETGFGYGSKIIWYNNVKKPKMRYQFSRK